MATVSSRHLFPQLKQSARSKPSFPSHLTHRFQLSQTNKSRGPKLVFGGHFSCCVVPRASPVNNSITPSGGDEEVVSLGTMKLPLNIDLDRFETLLFQWANSMNQGAQIPLPMPLKVDKVKGGVRLGFIEIGDGVIETPVYIDCLVSPAAAGSPPIFRATRDGPMKNRSPPGEARIMKSLLAALKTSVQLAAV